jgi:formamidopyrimidine-DNA glycosylase
MPELPEVETIKEDLRELVVGSAIERAEVLDPALVEQPSSEEFARRLEGVRITGARRRAKHLIVELDSGDALVFQLKIGGQLLLVPPVQEPRTALMLVLHLDGGRRLFLRDQTGFTRARLLGPEELEERLSPLGPEPLEEGFAVEYLREKIGSRRAQIKTLILDQQHLRGRDPLRREAASPTQGEHALGRGVEGALRGDPQEPRFGGRAPGDDGAVVSRRPQPSRRAPELPAGLREARRAVP